MNKPNLILTDFPWSDCYGKRTNPDTSFGLGFSGHYDGMTNQEILDFKSEIDKVSGENSILLQWTTFPALDFSIEAMKHFGYCVAPGTKILTNDLRYVNAEELKVGDKVMSFDENKDHTGKRYYKFGTVTSTGIVQLPCYKITLETGEEIICSDEHKWLCRKNRKYKYTGQSKWVMTKDLMDDYNGRSKYPWSILKLAPKSNFIKNYESGFLSAGFDAEGCLHVKRPRITFCQKDNPFLRTTEEYLDLLDINYKKYSYHNINHIGINGGFIDTVDFLMKCRPPRLMDKWVNYVFENALYNIPESSDVKSIEYIGLHDCVALSTDVGTYIAEGYASHNTYKTEAFVWIKTSKNGTPLIKPGYYFGSGPEVCLLGIKGGGKNMFKPAKQLLGATIMEQPREHSRKPEQSYERIELAYPHLDKMEFFSRQKRDGWMNFGNEVDKFG